MSLQSSERATKTGDADHGAAVNGRSPSTLVARLEGAVQSLGVRGIDASVVRMRPGCVIVRAKRRSETQPPAAKPCSAVQQELEIVAGQLGLDGASFVETSCVASGDPACLVTMTWKLSKEPPPAPRPPAPAPPAPTSPRVTLGRSAAAGRVVTRPAGEPRVPIVPAIESAVVPPVAWAVRRRLRRFSWVWRRAWLFLLAVIAASGAGWYVGHKSVSSYAASVTFVVNSGANQLGPGGANEADALADTYAGLMPSDSVLDAAVASATGDPVTLVPKKLTVVVEQSTAILDVTFSAPTAATALQGITALSRAVTQPSGTAGIAPRSLVLVQRPEVARTRGAKRYALPLALVLGVLLGCVLVLAAERSDPRVDSAEDLAEAAACPAVEMSDVPAAFATGTATSRTEVGAKPLPTIVVPLNRRALRGAEETAAAMGTASPSAARASSASVLTATLESSSALPALLATTGRPVLVVAQGERRRELAKARARLEAAGITPARAVLVPMISRLSLR